MIRVAFNNSALTSGHKTRGIGGYSRNLLEQLNKRDDIKIQEFSDIAEVKDADIVHYPFLDLFQKSLPEDKNFPTVVTVHDVTPLVFSKQYPSGLRGGMAFNQQKKIIQTVEAVITDSQCSKKDIIKYLGIDTNKIFSIYLAADNAYRVVKDEGLLNEIREKYNLPEKFAIYIGDINYNKNIVNILRACKEVNLSLVICGKQAIELEDLLHHNKKIGPRDLLRQIIGKPHPEISHLQEVWKLIQETPNIYRLGFVPTQDLVLILNNAQCLLMPSLYEGFGLPILEAQICGVPVITSNISSMPEVASDGALLVDPYNIDEIIKAISKITRNHELANQLIKLGFENIERFSWEKTAQETINIYKKVISTIASS